MHEVQHKYLSDVQQLQQQLLAQQTKTRDAHSEADRKAKSVERLAKELEALRAPK